MPEHKPDLPRAGATHRNGTPCRRCIQRASSPCVSVRTELSARVTAVRRGCSRRWTVEEHQYDSARHDRVDHVVGGHRSRVVRSPVRLGGSIPRQAANGYPGGRPGHLRADRTCPRLRPPHWPDTGRGVLRGRLSDLAARCPSSDPCRPAGELGRGARRPVNRRPIATPRHLSRRRRQRRFGSV